MMRMTDALWKWVAAIYEFEYELDDQAGAYKQLERAVKEEERE